MQKTLLENQDVKEQQKFESYNGRGTMGLCWNSFPKQSASAK